MFAGLADLTNFLEGGLDRLNLLVESNKPFYLAYLDIDYIPQYSTLHEAVLQQIIFHSLRAADQTQVTCWHLSRDDFLILSEAGPLKDICDSILNLWAAQVYCQPTVKIMDGVEIQGGLGLSIAVLYRSDLDLIDFARFENQLYTLLREAKKHNGCKCLVQEDDRITLTLINNERMEISL